MVKRSFGPGLVLAGVSAFAVGAILYVHYDQKWQKEVSLSWSSRARYHRWCCSMMSFTSYVSRAYALALEQPQREFKLAIEHYRFALLTLQDMRKSIIIEMKKEREAERLRKQQGES
jgi:hypothetical protein